MALNEICEAFKFDMYSLATTGLLNILTEKTSFIFMMEELKFSVACKSSKVEAPNKSRSHDSLLAMAYVTSAETVPKSVLACVKCLNSMCPFAVFAMIGSDSYIVRPSFLASDFDIQLAKLPQST